MESNSHSLENRLHERISQIGKLGFWLVPGSLILDARKDPERKAFIYAISSCIEGEKLIAYFVAAYGLYQLAEKLF